MGGAGVVVAARHRWVLEGGETTTQLPELHSEEAVPLRWRQMPWLDTPALEHGLRGAALIVLDARSPERYRGEVEPLDPVAGHIPGALNRPCSANLDAGLFKSAAEVVHSCGSGVTACHNLLAMEHAGLPGSRLYPPSYSGWVADPERRAAVERGG